MLLRRRWHHLNVARGTFMRAGAWRSLRQSWRVRGGKEAFTLKPEVTQNKKEFTAQTGDKQMPREEVAGMEGTANQVIPQVSGEFSPRM